MLKLRRGTDTQRAGVTFEEAEPVYVTDTKKLWIGDGATAGGILVSGGGDWVINEIPTGALNGSNATFTSEFDFDPDTIEVKVNGLILKKVDDFNTAGTTTITLTFSPGSNENILISYIKA